MWEGNGRKCHCHFLFTTAKDTENSTEHLTQPQTMEIMLTLLWKIEKKMSFGKMGKKNLLFANEFDLLSEKKPHEKNAGLCT